MQSTKNIKRMNKPKTLILEHRGENYKLHLEPCQDEKLSFQYLYISNKSGGFCSKLIAIIPDNEVKELAKFMIDENLKYFS